jgi:hypothetical protein
MLVQTTGALRAEIQRRISSTESADQCVRVTREASGSLRLVGDSARDGDVTLLSTEHGPLLVAAPEVAAALDGAILHYRERADDLWGAAGLAVLWPRSSHVRAAWAQALPARRRTPLWASVRSVVGRLTRPQSTTEIVSP